MRTYLRVEISFVNGINQTNHSTNQERPCTTTQWIEKELSICQSLHCPDLVKFPVLSQIKPHTPRLVVLIFAERGDRRLIALVAAWAFLWKELSVDRTLIRVTNASFVCRVYAQIPPEVRNYLQPLVSQSVNPYIVLT